MSLPVIYISKRCDHCLRLVKMLHQRQHLKGHYKIVSIDDAPFPQSVKSVPCMIIDNQLVNATDLFNYILSSDNKEPNNGQQVQQGQRQGQRQEQPQQCNQEQSCSVDELSGVCANGSCLDFSPINDSDTIDNINYSFLDEPSQPTMNNSSNNDHGSQKRKEFDNDYERMMAERGEMMPNRQFA